MRKESSVFDFKLTWQRSGVSSPHVPTIYLIGSAVRPALPASSPKPQLEARKVGCNHSDYQLVENGLLQLRICSSGRNADVVDPLHESVALGYVILLFVVADLVSGITIVAITDHQRFQIAR